MPELNNEKLELLCFAKPLTALLHNSKIANQIIVNSIIYKSRGGEMVDAADSKSAGSNTVGVQVPSPAPLPAVKVSSRQF